MLLVEERGELLGYVACGASRDADADGQIGEVLTLFVAPSSWRRGAGRALLRAAIHDLRGRGYGAATVWSFADNVRANSFYESQGFERDGAERREPAWAEILERRYRRALP